jgi:hypothetical protein
VAEADFVGLVIMATVTGVLGVGPGMASLTIQRAMASMVQGKCVHLHPRWRPGLGGMAVMALQAKEAFVNDRLGVTFDTLDRDLFKYFVRMTGLTGQRSMRSIQNKEIGMVEIVHAVGSIMAVQAGRSKFRQVLPHENRLAMIFRMAIHTNLHVEILHPRWMTVFTGHHQSIEIPGMARQAEMGCNRMVKRFPIQAGRRPSRSAVAVGTVLVEYTPVRIRLSMALGTIARCVFKHIGNQQATARI